MPPLIDYPLFNTADAELSSSRPVVASASKAVSSSLGPVPKAQALAATRLHLVDEDELYDEDQLFAKQASLLSPKKDTAAKVTAAEDDEFDF